MKLRSIFVTIYTILFCPALFSQMARPQDPKAPFNYTTEEVVFVNYNADSIALSGTLSIPKNIKTPPVAILISGSGPQNRDSELAQFNHRPFLVLSDYLTNHGIAVLRYDERGIGKSEGIFKNATSFDFASDVMAAFDYLKTRTDIDTGKIGLIGHSEGGLVASIVASRNGDVAFAVLLAGPGVDGATVSQTQSRRLGELTGTPKAFLDENEKLSTIVYDVIKQYKDVDTMKTKIRDGLNEFKQKNPMSVVSQAITPVLIEQQFKILESEWLISFIRTHPKTYLENTACPVLALNGSLDIQVLPDINLEGIRAALEKAGNKDVTIKELEGLNHLFQTAETGNVNEYSQIEETFSPIALKIIRDWVLERF